VDNFPRSVKLLFEGCGLNQTAALSIQPVVCACASHIDTIELAKQKLELNSPFLQHLKSCRQKGKK
jgi:hypothetical protein